MSEHPEVVSTDRGEERRGIYDGFEGYRTATADDYGAVFANGMVVLDTNVLLNLYRYTEQARDDLLQTLERLGDQLWVPHHVVLEFWRNREDVLRDPRDTERTAQELFAIQDRAVSTFRSWANRVSLAAEQSQKLIAALDAGFDAVMEGVDKFNDASAVDSARNTENDVVLRRLEAILDAHVGGPLDDAAYEAAIKEGLRRSEAREPPGYLDRHKDDDRAAGDYIVWEQILVEATRRTCDVVLITGDVKEDWWRREAGEQRGPRLELVQEMRARTGSRLFMLRPPSLLSLAAEVLSVAVHDESVTNTDRIDRLSADRDRSARGGGWTAEALEKLLAQLEAEAPVQAAVLMYAARNGGSIDREKVYEIGEYDSSRSLRGFSRPLTRIAQGLRDAEDIDSEAVELLETAYDPWSYNPSMAIGFAIHQSVLPMLIEALDQRAAAQPTLAEAGS